MAINKSLRIGMVIAALLCLVPLTGCWDDAEINGRAFVLGFGADSGSGGADYDFTFQLAIPVSGESDSAGSIEYSDVTVREITPAAAVRTLEKNLGREINFEQLCLIVIGEPLSRQGFTGLTDYFFRRASVRRQSCIAVCDGSAKDFFAASATDKAISTDAASTLQSYDAGSGKIAMDLFSLYKTLINRDGFFLPKLTRRAAKIAGENAGQSNSTILSLSGALAYGKDGGFRGVLDEEELELLRLTCGSGTGGALPVYDDAGNRFCCQIRQSDCQVKSKIADGVPAFRLHLELVLVPLDAGGLDGSGYSTASVKHISRSAEQTVKAQLEALVHRSQTSLGASVLGLQDILRQRHPDWYALHEREWERIYPSSHITITVKCTAAGGGITQ